MKKNLKNTKSKFRLAPINTGLSRDGEINEQIISFHRKRASPYISCSMLGNVAIDEFGRTNTGTPVFNNIRQSELEEFVRVVASEGSAPGIQISQSYFSKASNRSWRPQQSVAYLNRLREMISTFEVSALEMLLGGFFTARKRAIDAGFQIVQFHAAHGYFLSSLLDGRINQRRDHLGDLNWILNRLLGESAVDHDGVEFRISLYTGIGEQDDDLLAAETLIGHLYAYGIRRISLSDGHYDLSRSRIYPAKTGLELPNLVHAEKIRKSYSGLKIDVSGNISDLSRCEDLASEYEFSIGRNLIANPRYVEDYFEKRAVHSCQNRNLCHFFSRGVRHIECGMNDALF